MSGPRACGICGAQVVTLRTYRGDTSTFDAVAETAEEVPLGRRWYVSKSRGAVPASMEPAREPGAPFLILHSCGATRRGTGEPEMEEHTIANSTGPTVAEITLESAFGVSYRWPGSWAHITLEAHSLCGARVLKSLSEAERRRTPGMKACPDCLERYPRRLARLAEGT